MRNNYRYSVALVDYCQEQGIPFLYASSASVYGAGQRVSRRTRMRIAAQRLRVLQVSVRPVRARARARSHGADRRLSLFQCLRDCASSTRDADHRFAFHFFNQFRAEGKGAPLRRVGRLCQWRAAAGLRSRRRYRPGESVLSGPSGSLGHLQSGNRRARESFNDVATAVLNAVSEEPPRTTAEGSTPDGLKYIAFPPRSRANIKAIPKADLTRLRAAGYTAPFAPVEGRCGTICQGTRAIFIVLEVLPDQKPRAFAPADGATCQPARKRSG